MNYSHILSFLFLSTIFCYELEIAILSVLCQFKNKCRYEDECLKILTIYQFSRRLLELTVLLFDSVKFAWKYYMYKKKWTFSCFDFSINLLRL